MYTYKKRSNNHQFKKSHSGTSSGHCNGICNGICTISEFANRDNLNHQQQNNNSSKLETNENENIKNNNDNDQIKNHVDDKPIKIKDGNTEYVISKSVKENKEISKDEINRQAIINIKNHERNHHIKEINSKPYDLSFENDSLIKYNNKSKINVENNLESNKFIRDKPYDFDTTLYSRQFKADTDQNFKINNNKLEFNKNIDEKQSNLIIGTKKDENNENTRKKLDVNFTVKRDQIIENKKLSK